MRPVPGARQTRAQAPTAERRRLHHRRHLRGRVPGHRPVLPAGRGRLPAGPAALGHGDLDAQDPGRQAPLVGVEDGPQIQGHDRDTRTGRARASRPASNASGRKPLVARFGGIPLQTAAERGHHRPRPGPGHHPHKELVTRLLADRCEICTGTDGISVHHVRKLADLTRRDGRSPRGRSSWPGDGARPWWSAGPATTPSTRAAPHRTLTQ